MFAATGQMSNRAKLGWILAVGLVIRTVIILTTGGHTWDLVIMGEWAENLRYHRTDEFYYIAKTGDHLPGDLWIHFFAIHLWAAFAPGPDLFNGDYYTYIRFIPALSDLIIGALLFSIVSRVTSGSRALLVAGLFVLNPAAIFISSLWGQWDAVSMAMLLGGLAITLRRPDRWLWAVPLVAWAVTVKPPLALPGALILLLPLLLSAKSARSVGQWVRHVVMPGILAIIAGIATILVVCVPYSVGLPGMATNWTLLERANIALDLYPFKVLAAGNIWMLEVASFDQIDDRHPGMIGLNAHDLGNVYLGIAAVCIAAVFVFSVWRSAAIDPREVLVWACASMTFATYMLPTRVHERYLFPALVLTILMFGLIGLGRRALAFIGLFSMTFVANLAFVYWGFDKGFAPDYGEGIFAAMLRASSLVNIALFLICLLVARRWLNGSSLQSRRTRHELRKHHHVNSIANAPGD